MAREIAAVEVFGEYEAANHEAIKTYIITGGWPMRPFGGYRCDDLAQRITEYGEACAHNAAMEER